MNTSYMGKRHVLPNKGMSHHLENKTKVAINISTYMGMDICTYGFDQLYIIFHLVMSQNLGKSVRVQVNVTSVFMNDLSEILIESLLTNYERRKRYVRI